LPSKSAAWAKDRWASTGEGFRTCAYINAFRRDLCYRADKGDVHNGWRTQDCPEQGQLTSTFPDAESSNHCNLAEQNCPVGPVLRAGTPKAPGSALPRGDRTR